MKKNTHWFSMIEVLVGIFIFSLWLTAIYILLLSTLKFNDYSKNSIIASNLAREWIEMVKNIRDGNYNTLYKWNKLPWNDVSKVFSTGSYYTIENDYSTWASFPISMEKINDFWEGKNELKGKMESYKLCLDSKQRYTHTCYLNTPTYFYRYITFEDVVYKDWGVINTIENALKLKSKVIWYSNGYHEIELNSIITDWQRQ